MDLTLHLGAHRTASTTLQRVLSDQTVRLEHRGVALWTPPHTRDGRLAGLMGDPGFVSARREVLARRSGNRVRMAQSALVQDGLRRLVVSEENLLGGLRENLSLGALYPTARRRLERLAEAFPTVQTVGFAIRAYDTYWPSALAFMIQRGYPMPDAEHLARIAHQPRTWRDVIEDVAEAFPSAEVMVWSYERLGGLPHLSASALAGVPVPVPQKPIHLNKSPSAEALQNLLLEAGENPTVIHTENGRFMPFTAPQRDALKAAYAKDIAWLKAGASGLATYIDNEAERPITRPVTPTAAPSQAAAEEGVSDREGNHAHEGRDNTGPHEAVAGTRDEGTARKTP